MSDPKFPTARDEMLFDAIAHLQGHARVDRYGVGLLMYPPSGSELDLKGRRAVAAALRESVPDRHLCEVVAALFEAEGTDRKIEFKHQSRNRPKDRLRSSSIVMQVWMKLKFSNPGSGGRITVATAQADVAEEIGLSFENVKRVWQEEKALRTALDSVPMPKQSGR